MHRLSCFQIMLMALFLAGCTVGPEYQPPVLDIPEQWQTPLAEGMVNVPAENVSWWESLNDPVLNDLIQRAAQQNLDLNIASTRILEARSEWKGKTGELYPHLDGSLTGGSLYHRNNGLIRDLLGCSSHGHHSGKKNVNFFEAGFDASWEIDLFGAAKHEINALQARVESTEEGFYDAWVTLSAEVARQYIQLRSLQQRRILLDENINSQKETIHLTNELLSIGFSSTIDRLQSEQQLSVLEAQRPLVDLSIEKTLHRLSILLGDVPGCTFSALTIPGNLPQIPCEQPVGLPSELLRRRPDIRKAERELAAATEMVGAAVASLFPRLSLYGFIGDIGTQLKNLSNGSGMVWFAAPQLLVPLFNSRLLQQDVSLNKIRAQESLFNYQKTVLESLEEVENSIASYRYEWERNQILEQTLQRDRESFRLMLDLYQRGVKGYLDVLTVNRSLVSSQEAYLQSQTEMLIHYISLYKALGGAWDLCICSQTICNPQ